MSTVEPFILVNTMPCCGESIDIIVGPRGGILTNIKCGHCNTKFNAYVQKDWIMIFEIIDDPLKKWSHAINSKARPD